MLSHSVSIRVRYSETDQMGYVYYGQYASYFEVGRVETMRQAGLHYSTLEREHGILMPVMNMHMRFVRPATYDDELTVRSEIRQMPDTDIVFHTEVYLPNGKLATAGRITLVVLEAGSRRRLPVPEFIKETLKPYFV